MPVQVGDYAVMPADTFETLRFNQPQSTHPYNPRMVELLETIADGAPVRVELLPGQTPRTLRSAVSNSARSRGLKLESLVGDGYVAFRLLERVPAVAGGRPKK